MKDYTELTDQELFDELEKLETAKEQDYIMDGSGECGPFIEAHYLPYEEAINEEINKRGIYIEIENDLDDGDLPF